MSMTEKLDAVLRETGETRTAFAIRAGVSLEWLSRLFPRGGRKSTRTARYDTMLRVIAASHGIISFEDFRACGATREKPIVFEHACPLCGQGPGNRRPETILRLAV